MSGEWRGDSVRRGLTAKGTGVQESEQGAAHFEDQSKPSPRGGAMVIVLDQWDRIASWNREAGEYFHFAEDPEAGMSEVSRLCWPMLDDQHAAFAEARGRGAWSVESTLVRGGKGMDTEVILSTLCDANGENTGKVIVIRDAPERKRLESGRKGVMDKGRSDTLWVECGTDPISICAECKSMRDSVTDWQQADAYVSQQFNVSFAYAMCPECVRRLYPELNQDESPSLE